MFSLVGYDDLFDDLQQVIYRTCVGSIDTVNKWQSVYKTGFVWFVKYIYYLYRDLQS